MKQINEFITAKNVLNTKEVKEVTDNEWMTLCDSVGIAEIVELIKDECDNNIQRAIYDAAKKKYNF